jgi:hypothetical protein
MTEDTTLKHMPDMVWNMDFGGAENTSDDAWDILAEALFSPRNLCDPKAWELRGGLRKNTLDITGSPKMVRHLEATLKEMMQPLAELGFQAAYGPHEPIKDTSECQTIITVSIPNGQFLANRTKMAEFYWQTRAENVADSSAQKGR